MIHLKRLAIGGVIAALIWGSAEVISRYALAGDVFLGVLCLFSAYCLGCGITTLWEVLRG